MMRFDQGVQRSSVRMVKAGRGSELIKIIRNPLSDSMGKRSPSVATSDHACARKIALVSTQESKAAPQPVQLTEIGIHWSKLVKKKVIVQRLTTSIMAHIA